MLRRAGAAAGVSLPALPTDAEPWDRLHVWLIDGEGLAHRPRLWPFEPYIVVTSEGPDTGSSPECPVGAYEFRVRSTYTDPCRPVWDERGMLCYRRGGATSFKVLVSAQSAWASMCRRRPLFSASWRGDLDVAWRD